MPDEADVRIRRAEAADLDAVVALTNAAYAHYTKEWGAPPLPVTEDYGPHIRNGGVWLLEQGGQLAGLIVLEKEPDHMLIFSVAVAPPFQGRVSGSGCWNGRRSRCAKPASPKCGCSRIPGWSATSRSTSHSAIRRLDAGQTKNVKVGYS